jgi:hypothetical protein
MKIAIIGFLLVLSVTAKAACRDIYEPMSRQWVYVCSADNNPRCHSQYDPMNRTWVLVCSR